MDDCTTVQVTHSGSHVFNCEGFQATDTALIGDGNKEHDAHCYLETTKHVHEKQKITTLKQAEAELAKLKSKALKPKVKVKTTGDKTKTKTK